MGIIVSVSRFEILALPCFIIFLIQKLSNNRAKILPHGPPCLPLIGNLLHLASSPNPHIYLWNLSQKYGPLMSLQLGFRPTLVISSAKMAKEIMKTHDLSFCSRPSLRGQQKLSYNGLDFAFSPYSSYWREIWKICVVHLFNPNRVLLYRRIREDEVARMINKISKLSVGSKPIINLSEALMNLMNLIIYRVSLGKRYEEDKEGVQRSRFHELLNESQAVFASFFISDYVPSMSWVDRFSGLLGSLEKNFKDGDTFYQELIEEHLDPNRPKPKREDFLDVLSQIWRDRSSQCDLTFNHIKAMMMVIDSLRDFP